MKSELDLVAHTFNPCTQEAEAGGSESESSLGYVLIFTQTREIW